MGEMGTSVGKPWCKWFSPYNSNFNACPLLAKHRAALWWKCRSFNRQYLQVAYTCNYFQDDTVQQHNSKLHCSPNARWVCTMPHTTFAMRTLFGDARCRWGSLNHTYMSSMLRVNAFTHILPTGLPCGDSKLYCLIKLMLELSLFP